MFAPPRWEHWSWGYELAGAWGAQSSSKLGNCRCLGSDARKSPCSGGAGDFGMVKGPFGVMWVALGTATLKLCWSLQGKRFDMVPVRKGPFHAPEGGYCSMFLWVWLAKAGPKAL